MYNIQFAIEQYQQFGAFRLRFQDVR